MSDSTNQEKSVDDREDPHQDFARAFMSFLNWVHTTGTGDQGNEVVRLVRDIVGSAGRDYSVVGKQLPPFEHVNVQTAVNAWAARTGRRVQIHGITLPPHHQRITLQQLLTGEMMPPIRLSAPGLVDLPSGPGRTLACLKFAVLNVTDERGRYVLLLGGPAEHEPQLTLEIGGLPVAAAQSVLAELDDLRNRLNVYRGQVVEVSIGPMGAAALVFADLPATSRDDVVLPVQVLDRIERHALGVAEHRAQLLAAGQHLKRGLLLYGPPGTGKTHTTRYLIGQLRGYTRLLLTGRSLHVVGSITELARTLEPSMIVLEDVDLVAEDRSFGPGSSPVLFDLLDAMDGAAGDADLLFVLTTNRADLLEPALAARPGRVDVAVEIGLPEADARRQLLELYGRGVPLELTDQDVALAVERTEGVTASFLKELVRRAVLEALREHPDPLRVTGTHLDRATTDLMDAEQGVTRTLLGMGADSTAAAMPGPFARRGHPGRAVYSVYSGG